MNQQKQEHPLRKAAVLVASLDRETADRMVAQMPAEQLELLHEEIARLGTIDPVEQRTVIDEFFRGQRVLTSDGDSLELSSTVEQQLSAVTPTLLEEAPPAAPTFEPFRTTDAVTLAKVMSDEPPQIVALVMARLTSTQAVQVLTRLSPELQVDVMRRLSDLDEPDAVTLREVERVLTGRLAHAVRDRQRRATGLAALDGILQAADSATARQLLVNLSQHDQHLAARLTRDEPPEILPLPTPRASLSYADFLAFDDRSIGVVLQSADREIVLLALAGSTPQFVSRVAKIVGPTSARKLDQAMESLGPILLSDLEAAQYELAQLAADLLDEGVIELPRRRAALSMAA